MSVDREIREARAAASAGGLYVVMDELSTYTDRSGNGNNQTAISAPTRGSDLLSTDLPTLLGGGARPDRMVGSKFASGQYVEFSSSAVSFASGQPLTVACWVKRHTLGSGAQVFLGRGSGAGVGVGGAWYSNGSDLIFFFDNGVSVDSYCILRSLFPVGTLLHIAVAVGSDNVARLYVNGTQRTFEFQIAPSYTPGNVTSQNITNRVNQGLLRVGQASWAGPTAPTVSVHGALVVQKELTASQVKSLYMAGLARPRRRVFGGFGLAAAALVAVTMNVPANPTTAWVKDAAANMAPTQGWEASAVQEVSILPVSGGDRMWYSAAWANEAIGTAFRATGSSTWAKETGNPIIGQGNGGVAGACGRPVVIEVAGTFHMYFNLNSGTAFKHATSTDGVTWTTPTSVFTIPFGTIAGNCSIVIDSGTWYMVYEALDGVWKMGYATSSDGLTWTNQAGPLTSLSIGGAYGGPDLHGAPGAWTLYFHASASGNVPTDIYKSTSTNLATWTTPILQVTRTLAWEVDQVADPYVRTEGGSQVMYYSGVNNATEASKVSRAVYS